MSSARTSIKWLNLELNSSCNLRCRWCALDHSKGRVQMTPALLEKVFNELTTTDSFSLERIDLHNAGETLLHDDIPQMLHIISKAIKDLRGQPIISLLTNATLLTAVRSYQVIRSGALSEIRFSVDGGTKEAYEQIRLGAKWNNVSNNIINFVRLNKIFNGGIKTGIICIIPSEREMNMSWMSSSFQELLLLVDHYELRYPHNWDGSVNIGFSSSAQNQIPNRVCKFLLKNLVVLPNGDVTVCCADLNSRGVIGNVRRDTLINIFNTQERLSMIAAHEINQKQRLSLCANCAGYYE